MTSSALCRALPRNFFALMLMPLLACLVFSAQAARAQDHVVSSQALQQQIQTNTATRQQNIETLTNVLATPVAQRVMKDNHFDPVKVRSAIPTLSDAELANLAQRANDGQQKFSAGLLGLGMWIVILIAIIVIIVVVAVH
ncbi:MAG TPA: PA2779 family protein [Acidobacteriaceae bacterium]|nr:PA2779 family protein [Acidobacteriaceae bacterium]